MIATADRLQSVQEYYFSRKLREVRQLIAEGNPVINMGIGSPDLAPDVTVIEAMQKAMFDDKAHEYQSYQGLPELRKGMADFYKNHFNVDLDFNTEILPLMGSKEGIMHISLAFLNEGDEALISSEVTNLNSKIIMPCFVGKGVVLKNSTIGPFTSIGEGTIIEDSNVKNSIIQTHSVIKNATLDNAMIGNHAVFNGDFTNVSIGDYSMLK